ncbi:hypothetical protein [Microbacterium dauci]|uniref:Major tail protein n=1 Tax=Microbacterium dauci TaxID=3048008 RepID=A0ABT6ZGV3_9MICO|nr:hypothetical protein [Microbacterium sp. LX3-4]MDJ1115387.1 hypothetical protein [Microbacterium sp. LX3-4]
MATIRNAAYFGTTGTLTVDDDEHYGVTSCALIPTAPSESVIDISGDIQSFVGDNAWELQIAFHQDWKTAGSLSKRAIEWHGQTKDIVYTPQDGGDAIAATVRFKAAQVGGDTGRHSATLNLGVIGQPTFTAPVGG